MSDEAPGEIRIPETDEELLKECRAETFRSGGPGGQHQNTTESGVRLVHEPTGMRAEARDERSQHRNKAIALERLREKLEDAARPPPVRKATRVPRAQKRKRLEEKRQRSEKKQLRRPPKRPED